MRKPQQTGRQRLSSFIPPPQLKSYAGGAESGQGGESRLQLNPNSSYQHRRSSPGSTAGAAPTLPAAPRPQPQQPCKQAASAGPPAWAQRLSHLSQAPLPCSGP